MRISLQVGPMTLNKVFNDTIRKNLYIFICNVYKKTDLAVSFSIQWFKEN